MAKRLEDLPVYSKAEDFCDAIDALLEKPAMRRNSDLRRQITRANDSILANMEEGFEQGSDRAFANYLTHSKGSVGEVMGRLKRARAKKLLSPADVDARLVAGEELRKMLGGFIRYLHDTDWKDRGHHSDSEPPTRNKDSDEGLNEG